MNQMKRELTNAIRKYTTGLSKMDYEHFIKDIDVITKRHAPKPEVPAPIDKSRPPLQCPNKGCNNSGVNAVQYDEYSFGPEQCQFCYEEPNSFFNRSISYFEMVGMTHTKFRFPVYDNSREPEPISEELEDFRMGFLKDEVHELQTGIINADIVNIANELADVVVVALGTAHFYNIPFDAVFDEVYRANMSKERVKDASESKRGSDMDLLKPEGWVGPQLRNILFP